jgi:ADP-dependent NAD(P)H-hydrate dehydratase / NAD(P)H-hydrate epimerase
MRILTGGEVREATKRPGADPELLIRRAGYAVAQFCAARFKVASVCVVCGKGRKGGVGLVAAAALRQAADRVSTIILARDPGELSPDARACLSPDLEPMWIADAAYFGAAAAEEALSADLVIDAIVGSGFRPPLSRLAAAAVAAINDASGAVVAIDVPSGVDGDSRAPLRDSGGNMVFAHAILALVAPKPAHVFGELTAGPIAVNEIGAQPAAVPNATGLAVITGQDVGIALLQRAGKALPADRFGHVLVVAGSRGRAGAAALAGMAAMSAGAGAVTVACPASIEATVAGFSAGLMTLSMAETAEGAIACGASDRIEALLDKDSVVLGPGLSRNVETAAFVRRLVTDCRLPLVLVGDGLSAFEAAELRQHAQTVPLLVLVPHPGRLAPFAGVSSDGAPDDRISEARRLAEATGACVVLKGHRTVVAGASGETWINMSGNPALAKAGMDDVLAGMIGAALARGGFAGTQERHFHQLLFRDLRVAAAVHLHGLAADLARNALHENSITPGDLIEALAEAFRDCALQVERSLFFLRK